MGRLLISERHLYAIARHGELAYPEECCGILIGRPLGGGDRETLVERILSAPNARDEGRHNRYLIGPSTVLAAHREAQAVDLEVVGYYHSHPDHPAVPSEIDREHAWPGLSYVIVAVAAGRAKETRSWRLTDDRSRFREEIVDPAPGARVPRFTPKEEKAS